MTVFLTPLFGCTAWTYDRIRLGMTPGEYDRALELNKTARSPAGLVQYARDPAGVEKVVFLILADDRRIAGKVRVSRVEATMGWRPAEFSYHLSAEADAALCGASEAGPVDALRVIAHRLSELPTERTALRGQALVLAGLVRILQKQPAIDDWAVPSDLTAELATIAPAGGAVGLARDSDARLRFHYAIGQEP